MKTGETFDVEIIDMGTAGEGIGRAEGIAVFVPETVPGDKARVTVAQMKKNFARGKAEALLYASPWRREPACSMAGGCGGCSLAFMSYEGQLALKKKWVTDRLKRIGGIEIPPVEDVIGMTKGDSFPIVDEEEEGVVGEAGEAALPDSQTAASSMCAFPAQQGTSAEQTARTSFIDDLPVRYRNKAQYSVRAGRLVKNSDGKYRNQKPCSVGFYQSGTHEILDCKTCLLQTPPAEAAAEAVRQYVREFAVSVYDEKTGMGLLRHVVVRSAFATGEVMVVLVVNGDRLPHYRELVTMLSDAVYDVNREGEGAGPFWSLESVILNVNRAKTSEILGKECISLAGKSTITDWIGNLQFEISPLSFYQVNPVQMKKLYDKVLEFADLTGKETVLDLYCGVGTIGLYCAKNAGRVIGIEQVKQAVLDANRNAVINGIVNAEYICGKAEEILPKRLSGVKADVVILDPPRAGCQPPLLEAVLNVSPKRIVYVSCDPATLARDVKMLGAGGYQVRQVQPVDMFPGCGNIETVVMLSHKKPDSVINVKVEFGEGEGKVPLDNIAKRAEAYKPKERVTYKMIKEYIEAKYGFKVHTAYIAEVKRDLGLPMYDAPNAVEELKQPRKHPTPEKVKAIKDALKHFEIIY